MMNDSLLRFNTNHCLKRSYLALPLLLIFVISSKMAWAQDSFEAKNNQTRSASKTRSTSKQSTLNQKVLTWHSTSFEYLIHQYLQNSVLVPAKLKENIDTTLNNLGLFRKNFELFTPKFSQNTQGRFKQVSSSFLQSLKMIDTQSIRHLSQKLMKNDQLRRQAYSLYLSYALLDQHHEWATESQIMMYSLMNDPFFEGPAHLNLRFKERVERYLRQLHNEIALNRATDQEKHLETITTIQSLDSKQLITHIGFWLRREKDQSRVILYRFLKDAIQTHLNDFKLKALSQVPASPLGLKNEILNQVYDPLLKQNIDSKEAGPYLGDLKHLVTHEGLNQGIIKALSHEMVNQRLAQSKQIESLKLWEQFSTYRLERPYEAHEKKRPFLFLNPRFIFWFNDHLIPNSNTPVLLDRLQQVYQRRYKRLFDLLLTSHHYLKNSLDLNKEKLAYSLSRFTANYDENRYLEQRYAQALKQRFPEQGTTVFTPAKAIGFWLKRELDGSAEYVWSTLNDLRSQLEPRTNQSEILK